MTTNISTELPNKLPNKLPISLEFFPPKTPEGFDKLRAVRQALYVLKPEFCSVTFGAGGSTQAGTFGTVNELLLRGCHQSHRA
jgi:methylenetetrahydrofolate reductase (NADPH)